MDFNIAQLLREVADSLESNPGDSRALSHMSQARLVRLIRDLNEIRALRQYEPRTDRTRRRTETSYVPELRPSQPDEGMVKVP